MTSDTHWFGPNFFTGHRSSQHSFGDHWNHPGDQVSYIFEVDNFNFSHVILWHKYHDLNSEAFLTILVFAKIMFNFFKTLVYDFFWQDHSPQCFGFVAILESSMIDAGWPAEGPLHLASQEDHRSPSLRGACAVNFSLWNPGGWIVGIKH